jgi:hypothetical protein
VQPPERQGRLSRATDPAEAMAAEIAEEVKAWLEETRTLLHAAELLVEWFTEEGTAPDEHVAFKECLNLPYRNLVLLDEWLRIGDSAPVRVSEWTAKRFEASEGPARAISPLLERIVMHQPDFVQTRHGGERLVRLWGQFIGNLGMYVCSPIWEAYPQFAPPDWSVRPKS